MDGAAFAATLALASASANVLPPVAKIVLPGVNSGKISAITPPLLTKLMFGESGVESISIEPETIQ